MSQAMSKKGKAVQWSEAKNSSEHSVAITCKNVALYVAAKNKEVGLKIYRSSVQLDER